MKHSSIVCRTLLYRSDPGREIIGAEGNPTLDRTSISLGMIRYGESVRAWEVASEQVLLSTWRSPRLDFNSSVQDQSSLYYISCFLSPRHGGETFPREKGRKFWHPFISIRQPKALIRNDERISFFPSNLVKNSALMGDCGGKQL